MLWVRLYAAGNFSMYSYSLDIYLIIDGSGMDRRRVCAGFVAAPLPLP